MRKLVLWGGVAGVVAALGAVAAAMQGCVSVSCEDSETCAPDGSADGPVADRSVAHDASDSGVGHHDAGDEAGKKDKDAGDGGAGDSAGDSSADAGCVVGAAPAEGGCISDESGLFVATTGSDTTGKGTMAKPYATVSEALGQLGGAASTAIYVCGGTYTDQITVSVGVSIYGGLTCTNGHWVYSSNTVPVLTGTTASFAVEVDGVSAAVDLEDLEIDGADASAGDSTIALWLNNSTNVSLHRVKVVGAMGGHGAKGPNGSATPNYATTDAGVEGGAGATGNTGGGGGANACVDGTMPQGGQGGQGGGSPGSGGNGTPMYTLPFPLGSTGVEGTATECTTAGTGGIKGSYGENGGAAGTVAANAGAWSVSGAAWVPSTSGPGTGGGPGQGGGGGGGNTGGGGGGGGAGGCGGATGKGGTSGGASFALLSIDSTVTLDHCQIVGGTGGAGGNGGDGEAGQTPGGPGSGAGAVGVAGCSGGTGGFGQGGGGGAGGAGGPSVAVAYTGTAPSDPGSTSTVTPGAAVPTQATGGAGGSGGTVPNPDDGTGGPAGTKTLPVATLSLPTTT
jgi:hypothetical protein